MDMDDLQATLEDVTDERDDAERRLEIVTSEHDRLRVRVAELEDMERRAEEMERHEDAFGAQVARYIRWGKA